jgi:hypothetical protein
MTASEPVTNPYLEPILPSTILMLIPSYLKKQQVLRKREGLYKGCSLPTFFNKVIFLVMFLFSNDESKGGEVMAVMLRYQSMKKARRKAVRLTSTETMGSDDGWEALTHVRKLLVRDSFPYVCTCAFALYVRV